MIYFVLYLAAGSFVIFIFLLLCVRISVYIEDTCPTRFCVRRQQRRMRKKLIRRILYPDAEERDGGDYIPELGDDITADIICQPYIYRDAYSTGLTGVGRTLEAGRPPPPPPDGTRPSNPVFTTNHRIIFRRMFPQQILSHRRSDNPSSTSTVEEINLGERNILSSNSHPTDTRNDDNDGGAGDSQEGLPPAYSNLINLNSVTVSIEDESGSGIGGRHQPPPLDDDLDEPPPPSYEECIKSPPDFNSGLINPPPPPRL